MVFTCGLMDDASPLVNYVYQSFCDDQIRTTRMDQYLEREKSETHLKRLGKKMENTDLFRLLYSESAVQLPGSPLQNHYINWFDHDYDDQNGKQRNLSTMYMPSKHFEFRNLKEKLSDFKLPTSHHAEKVECFMSISNPDSEVTESLLSMCCGISQIQEITQLWLGNIKLQHGTDDMKLRLSPNASSLNILHCKLPANLTCELLAQLSICKQITEIYIDNMSLDDYAHLMTKTISSWDSPLLEHLYLKNCSIREESCGEILKSLATCQHIAYLSISGNRIGASGKHLAEAINNWGDAPLLELLYLNNCSIPEESCSEILKSLATCQHITDLSLDGNHIGSSGKHLADAINNWGDAPSLKSLYLKNCSIPEESCSEILKSLATCQHITHLNLTGNHIGASGKHLAEAINNWGDVPSLEQLYLENCSISEESCSEILKSLATCQHITDLSLDGNHIGSSGKHLAEAINNWGDAPSLKSLYLGNCSIPEESCSEILKSLATCQHITHLNLTGNHIGVSGKHLAEAINNWGDVPSLEQLYLHNCSIPEESCSEILKSLATCQHITDLSLDGNHIGSSGKHLADAINNWGDAPSLKSLYLKNCSIPEESCSEILKSLATCQHITHLNLTGNHIGVSGKHLAETINNWGDVPSLESLYLHNCSIPEESCSEIVKSLATCQHITDLSLDGNHIGSSGKHLAEAIINWGDVPSLEQLYLHNCSIPEESCSEIVKSLATCQHITDLSLDGNHIGVSGKHLAEAINNWGDAPSLKLLYLGNCSIPEESCSEILKSLATCQHITHLSLRGNHIGASGKHLADAINNWGDAPSLKLLYLGNCSIPEESCSEILKSLATCQHITHLSLDGNHIGASGKHLAYAINSWGDAPSLELLYLQNCSIPKDGWCDILKTFRTLIKHQRFQKLRELALSGNKLQLIEDEVDELLNTCLTEHKQKLTFFLDGKSFSEQFVTHWKEICAGTHLSPVFEYNQVNKAAIRTSETQPGSPEHDIDHLMVNSIKIEESSVHFQLPHNSTHIISNTDPQTVFSMLFKYSSLRMLSSEDVSIGNEVRHIVKAIHIWGPEPLLQELILTDSNIPDDLCGPLLKALSSCRHLAHLSLAGNHLGIHGIHLADTINTWGTNPKLKTLDLTDCSMPSSVCGALLFALGKCRNLTDVWLPDNTLTGCLHHFLSDSSQRLRFLEEIFLSYTKLNKRDVMCLAQLIRNQRMPQLGELDLCGNNLHRMEETIVDLVQALVSHHPRSLKLNIWFNYLSAPFQERLLSICINTPIELNFRPTESTFHNDSKRQGSTSSSLEEYRLKLQETFGDPSLRPTSAQWKDEDLLEGFFEDAEDTNSEDTGSDEDHQS